MGIWILRELGVDYQPCSGPHLRKMARLGDARFETLKSKGKQKDVPIEYWRINGLT